MDMRIVRNTWTTPEAQRGGKKLPLEVLETRADARGRIPSPQKSPRWPGDRRAAQVAAALAG